ncbi:MAG: hypothetical protein ACOY90_02015 [Candidatus Zhuqueibacterota bacterium]
MVLNKSFCLWVMVGLLYGSVFGQSEISDTIEEAKQLYIQKNLLESVNQLSRALELVNQELLTQIETIFPEPLTGWRAETPSSRVKKGAYTTGLFSTRQYFKSGGGPSITMEIETNTPRISNLKQVFVNPSMLEQMGGEAKISTVAERRCIERFDAIDKFAELIFIPSSTMLISIRGQDMKDMEAVAKFAEKIKWNSLEIIFP